MYSIWRATAVVVRTFWCTIAELILRSEKLIFYETRMSLVNSGKMPIIAIATEKHRLYDELYALERFHCNNDQK